MSGVSAYYLWEMQEVMAFNSRLQDIRTSSMQLVYQDLEALSTEFINPEFYGSGTTLALRKRAVLYQQIDRSLQQIGHEISLLKQGDFPDIALIRIDLNGYDEAFASILSRQQIRGFKNFGLEGKMRQYAHQLEKYNRELSLDKVLSLRRHEKDFFLRNDPEYLYKLNALGDQIQVDLKSGNPSDQHLLIASVVRSYQEAFNQLIQVQQEIGLKDQSGLKRSMDVARQQLNEHFLEASLQSQVRTASIIQKIKVQYAITGLTCIALSFLFSILISSYISKPISRLSDFMGRFILNHINSGKQEKIQADHAPYEMENLVSSFSKMTKQLRKQYHEISDKKRTLEIKNGELIKLNEELDRFVYSVSHDLRSPLTSLLGLIDLARIDPTDQAMPTYLQMMHSSVHKMDDFIQDILNFSRNKSQQVQCEEVDLERLIRDIFKQNSPSVDDHMDFLCEVDDDKSLYSDHQRLLMIFNNLISNAVRYQDPKKKYSFLHVKLKITHDVAYISLEDNGIGIGSEHIPHIFDKFYRASFSSKGSGLGLFIVREAVQKLQGEISVISELGLGTTFMVRVPNQRHTSPLKKQLAGQMSMVV